MRYLLAAALTFFAGTVLADQFSNGPKGIDSTATGLDGSGVLIGQVEPNRSGKHNYDDADHAASNTIPTGVYFQTQGGQVAPNVAVDEHGTTVAGVMIAQAMPDASYQGVAPNAQLHSISFGELPTDVDIALSMNRAATLGGGNVRAINMSFGRVLDFPIEPTDGNSHVARFVDWSSRQHDVLYINAMPEVGFSPYSTPSDSYNDITVAASDGAEGLVGQRHFPS